MNAEKNVQAAWNFIFDKLWCDKTKLIYDYRTSEGKDGAFRHLPTKEQIQASYPNPCGWYTGMEDGDISGGLMLDAAISRYEVTKEKEMKRYADDLYEGLMLNATLGKTKGFLIRTRHPEDGVTHYVNSSRDQYTHWIYAMVHFLNSELSSESQKEQIKKVLVEFAEKAEHDLTPDNTYHSLLNDEGKPSLVCYMKGEMINRHESLRTAMIYMAAYAVTKDNHWLEKYREERAWGLEFAELIDLRKGYVFKRSFALMQMQLSVRLIYDYEEDEAYKARYKALLDKVAEGCEHFILTSVEWLNGFEMPQTVIAWQDCPKEFIGTENNPYGYEVLNPNIYTASHGEAMWHLRNAADAIITQGLCPWRKMKKEQIDAFMHILQTVDFGDAFNHTPVSYCSAWWLLKEIKAI